MILTEIKMIPSNFTNEEKLKFLDVSNETTDFIESLITEIIQLKSELNEVQKRLNPVLDQCENMKGFINDVVYEAQTDITEEELKGFILRTFYNSQIEL